MSTTTQSPARSIAQEVREMAEGMTREELIAAWIRASEACEAAEDALEEAWEDMALLDKAASSHPLAMAVYDSLLFGEGPLAPASA